jgi:hypothetical protein
VLAIVFGTHNGFAQTPTATARTVQNSVLLSDPRGFGGGLLLNFGGDGPVVPFAGGVVGRGFGASSLFDGLVDDPTFVNVSGGLRVLTRSGGGALILRPFYERYFNTSDTLSVSDVNRFGVSIGASILF